MAKETAQSLKDKALRDLRAKKLPQALKKAKLGAKSYPREADFHGIAGYVLVELKRQKQAIPFFAEASRLKPNDPQYVENLANALMETHQYKQAFAFAQRKLDQFPDNEELQRVMDETIPLLENSRDVVEFASRKLEADPDNTRYLLMRLRAYKDINFDRESAQDLDRAYGVAPDDKGILFAKAAHLSQTGHSDQSQELLWGLLEKHKGFIPALLSLSSTIKDDRIDDLSVLVDQAQPSTKSHIILLDFAKANLIRKREGAKAAMPAFAKANAGQHETNPYSASDAEKHFAKTCKVFPEGVAPPTSSTVRDPMPIFIVGQPRSGTTLMEVMFDALSGVEGLGELMVAGELAKPLVEKGQPFTADAAQAFEASFRDLMPPVTAECKAFVDKLPHNYQRVGFLISAFPNAKVINMLRDPRDVGLSKWIRRFPAGGMRYSSNLSAIAHSANMYRKYMAHWNGLFGDRILTVQYEKLVEDPVAHSKTIAEFCGLPWTEDMTRPEDSDKQVRTASLMQVRKKISTKSVGGWREVAEHLKPMLDGFDPALWPEYDLGNG